LGSETEPPGHRCHVQCVFEHLVPAWGKLEELSDFDTSYITEEDRINGLRTLLTSYALPWLEQHSSTAAARQLAHLTYGQRLAQGAVMYEPTVRILTTSSALADGAPPAGAA
jgi:hypothetical protein